jgi:hypothetical protein
MSTQPSSTQATAVPAATDPRAPALEKVDEEKVDPAAHQELSMALEMSRFRGDMELMIASIRSGTGKVDADKADPENADPTATQPVDTEQADPTPADTEKTDAAHS